ncbi:MAG: sucrase ferredoxin [Corynebacterium sp.]|nr:sucrase ferredoxin [Corynebacterium sp.]
MTMCSDFTAEPLAGSAKQGGMYVLFEWPGGWSRDVLDGDTFSPQLSQQLKQKLNHVSFLLIRHPGREGRNVGKLHRCYLVWADRAVMELVLLENPEEILSLDLSGPGCNAGKLIDVPLALICTNGKRDVCCAVKGRPLAAALHAEFGDEMVWEASHMKGHRFAPVTMLMPWAYSFGRMNSDVGRQMVLAAQQGKYFWPANRGNGLLNPKEQVAELAVAKELLVAGEELKYGDLRVNDQEVIHADGRRWNVSLVQEEVSGVVSSCGDSPKTSTVWVAKTVTATQ